MALLGRVVSKVEGHVFELVFAVFCLGDQRGDGVAEETLVLRLGVELLAGEFDDVGRGVVAGSGELDQLGYLCGA